MLHKAHKQHTDLSSFLWWEHFWSSQADDPFPITFWPQEQLITRQSISNTANKNRCFPRVLPLAQQSSCLTERDFILQFGFLYPHELSHPQHPTTNTSQALCEEMGQKTGNYSQSCCSRSNQYIIHRRHNIHISSKHSKIKSISEINQRVVQEDTAGSLFSVGKDRKERPF